MKISINSYHWTFIACLVVVAIVSSWKWGIVFNTTDQLPHESMVMERFSENYAVHVFHNKHESRVYNEPESGVKNNIGLLSTPYYYSYKFFGISGLVIIDSLLNIAAFLIVIIVLQRLVLNRWLSLFASVLYVTRMHVFVLEKAGSFYREIAYNFTGIGFLTFLFVIICLSASIFWTKYINLSNNHTNCYLNPLTGIIMIMSAFYLSYLCFYDDYWRAMRPYASHPVFWATIWGLILTYDKSPAGPYVAGISLALLAQLNPYAFIFICPILIVLFLKTLIAKAIPIKNWIFAATISFIIILPFIYNVLNADPNAGRPSFTPIRSGQVWGYLNQQHLFAFIVISITASFLNINKLREGILFNLLLLYAYITFMTLPIFYYTVGLFFQSWHFWHLNDKSVFLFAEILFILGCVRLVQVKAYDQSIIQKRFLAMISVLLFSSTLQYSAIVLQPRSTRYSQDFINLSKALNSYKGQEYVLGTLHEKAFWLWSAMGGYTLIPGAHARMSVEEVDRRLFYYFNVLELTADQVNQVLVNHDALSGEVVPIYRHADKLPFVKRDKNKLLETYKTIENMSDEYRIDLIVIDKHVRPVINQGRISASWKVVLDTPSYLLLENTK